MEFGIGLAGRGVKQDVWTPTGCGSPVTLFPEAWDTNMHQAEQVLDLVSRAKSDFFFPPFLFKECTTTKIVIE